jgi:hypothetical protein
MRRFAQDCLLDRFVQAELFREDIQVLGTEKGTEKGSELPCRKRVLALAS